MKINSYFIIVIFILFSILITLNCKYNDDDNYFDLANEYSKLNTNEYGIKNEELLLNNGYTGNDSNKNQFLNMIWINYFFNKNDINKDGMISPNEYITNNLNKKYNKEK